MFIVTKPTKEKTGHYPDHIDCQGFFHPCKNFENPNQWKTIAYVRLDFSFKIFRPLREIHTGNFN